MKFVWLFLIVLLNCQYLYPQGTTTITGFVRDYRNDSALAGCEARLIKNSKAILTDSVGRFSGTIKCDCIDTLIISKDGYCTLIIPDLDPSKFSKSNELVFNLNRDSTFSIIFHEVYKKKFLGITYKHIYVNDNQKTSTCCEAKDTSYYKGWISFKTEDSIWYNRIRCSYNTSLNEILKKTKIYYNKFKNTTIFNLNETDEKPLYIDSMSPCYVYKENEIDSIWSRNSGKFKEGYAQYIKEMIKKLQIRHEAKISIRFVLEYNDTYSNFKIIGINEEDKKRIIEIIKKGPPWPPQNPENPRLRLEKSILIDMLDNNNKSN